MPVKSLMELATAACVKNIRELESVGDYLPYENVRNILSRVDNAYQLRQIELNSPQIEGETGEIWLKIIQRDFPMEYKVTAYKPPHPSKWYRVWEKYKKDHDQALQESEAKLMNALNGLKQTKIMNTSRIVDRRLLPRAGPKRGWGGPRDHTTTTLAFARGSRTKTSNGASVMRKVRREVKEIASIHGTLSRPVRGSAALSRPSKAPAAMVNDYRRAAQPVFRPTPKEELSSAVMEHEERATFISDSEEDDDDDGNELFDDDEAPPGRAPAPKSFAKSSAASLLKKRPGASSTASPTKSYTSSSTSSAPKTTTKRSGLLSNSYKSSAAKPQVTTKRVSASPRPALSPEPYKPPQRLPREPTSPPPAPSHILSSPPPTTEVSAPLSAQPRKRKAVDIFMKRKKRA